MRGVIHTGHDVVDDRTRVLHRMHTIHQFRQPRCSGSHDSGGGGVVRITQQSVGTDIWGRTNLLHCRFITVALKPEFINIVHSIVNDAAAADGAPHEILGPIHKGPRGSRTTRNSVQIQNGGGREKMFDCVSKLLR